MSARHVRPSAKYPGRSCPPPGVGRFVDKMFRRRISGRFVVSILNVIPPLRDSSSYYSFSFIRPKVFSICISISNQTFSCIHCSCMLVGVGHLAEVSAGPVVSNSELLSPGRTPGLACLNFILLGDTYIVVVESYARYGTCEVQKLKPTKTKTHYV